MSPDLQTLATLVGFGGGVAVLWRKMGETEQRIAARVERVDEKIAELAADRKDHGREIETLKRTLAQYEERMKASDARFISFEVYVRHELERYSGGE